MNMNENEQKLTNSIDFLLSLNSNDLLNNKTALDEINFLNNSASFVNFDDLSDKQFYRVLINVLDQVYNVYSDLEIEYTNYEIGSNTDQSGCIIQLVFSTLSLIKQGCYKSVKFSRKISAQGALEVHFKFLKTDSFTSKFTNFKIIDRNRIEHNLIETILSNCYIFSKSCQEILTIWIEIDAVQTLLKIANLSKNFKLDSYLTIMNIVDDKLIENLSEIHEIIGYVQGVIGEIAQSFRDKKFNRQPRQVVEGDQFLNVEVHCVKKPNGDYLSLFVFITGLYELSVNDKLRSHIYFKNDSKTNLKTILFEGNEIEMKYALRLLAQLSFNQEISDDLESQTDVMNFIKNLTQNNSILKLCNQIFWNIHQNKINRQITHDTLKKNEHIMISYNGASRDLCIRIKNYLESLGHKVWIDISDIHGSSLESMAKAIEDSYCVLICVTEKYRQSVYCQSEAQYAYKLKKPIIPLIMQKGYENVKGWLGIIMSDKIFINLMKYDFDECMRRLEGEIDSLGAHQDKVVVQTEKISIINWTESQVKEWFETYKLNSNIYEKFSPFSGVILVQLYEMRRDAPEFYYQSLKSDDNRKIDLNSVMNFTHCLKRIFE